MEDETMIKSSPFASLVPFRNGASVPSFGGTPTLASALAGVERAEAQLEAARAQAKAAARREGRGVSGLFAEGRFVSRATAEKWTDEARNEGWRAGHNFLSDVLSRASRPPDPADPFYHIAKRLTREGNRSLDEMLRYWARLDAAGFADATRAGDYEKAAQICIAVQREHETGKVTGAAITRAAARARMSADAAGEVPSRRRAHLQPAWRSNARQCQP
jgi:hypothetical protein